MQLYSWWIAPGEAQALQGLIDQYKKAYPGGTVDDSGDTSGANTRSNLDKVIDSKPPDVFQLNSQDLGTFLETHPGAVAPADGFFTGANAKSAFLADALKAVTFNGHIQAIPIDLPRESAFFYNKAIFKAHQLTVPTDVPSLLATCATLKAAGVTCIAAATGYEAPDGGAGGWSNGWIVRELFNGILQGTMGAALYKDFVTGAKPVSDPEVTTALQSAIHSLSQIITQYINTNSAGPSPTTKGSAFTWTDAADLVQAGKAAIFIHGDWVKGYWIARGWTPVTEFGQTGAPGASDLFVYGIDVLAMPTHAPDPTSAKNFMTVVASAAGQAAFSKSKGSSPARIDVGSKLDALGAATLNDLVTAKVRLPVYAPSAWDTGLAVFSASACAAGDETTLFNVFRDNPPVSASGSGSDAGTEADSGTNGDAGSTADAGPGGDAGPTADAGADGG